MKSYSVKYVLFDLGVVLVNLEYERALRRIEPLLARGRHIHGRSFFNLMGRDPKLAEYERGHLSTQAFFEYFREVTGFQGTLSQFTDIWCDIFSENVPMLDYAREVARRYPVYFMSNAGALHVPLVYDKVPRLKFCKDDAFSCAIGAVKPDREYYERALRKFGIRAEESLFIDDRPENVEGAVTFGIPSLLYTTPEETIAALRRRLGE